LLAQHGHQISIEKGNKMSIRKAMLLASMAVAAVAFAAPAGASASGMFLNNGEEITEPIEVEFTGTVGYGGAAGSFVCGVHPVLTVSTNSATINTLGLTTTDCNGTGGFAHCHLSEASPTSGSTLTPTATKIDLQGLKLFKRYTTGDPGTGIGTSETPCGVASFPGGLELTFENVSLTPDNPEAITSLTPSGNGVLDAIGVGPIAATEAFGELEAVVPETLSITG
jgi:hypothetical protein